VREPKAPPQPTTEQLMIAKLTYAGGGADDQRKIKQVTLYESA